MDVDDCGLIGVPEIPQQGPRLRKTGGVKRREANALPRVLFIQRQAANTICGAILITAAYDVDGSGEYHWHIARFILLVLPFLVDRSSVEWRSAVSKLKAQVSQTIRESVVVLFVEPFG